MKINIEIDSNNYVLAYTMTLAKFEKNIEVTLEENLKNEFIKNYDCFKYLEDRLVLDKEKKLKKEKPQVSIEEVKKAKREELKAKREEKISENLVVNGDEFQVKEKDLQNFYNLKIVVDLDSSKANEKINWVLADNRIKEFSYSELMNVLTTYILRKQDLFTQFGKISIKLETCKTVEEIENLKWS